MAQSSHLPSIAKFNKDIVDLLLGILAIERHEVRIRSCVSFCGPNIAAEVTCDNDSVF